jgi:hypothetical protein
MTITQTAAWLGFCIVLMAILGGCAVQVTAPPCPVLASHLPIVLDQADTRTTKHKVANANTAFAEVCAPNP